MKLRILILTALLLCGSLFAENSAIIPATRSTPTNWIARHDGFVEVARKGNIDLLFLGDSITDRWRKKGLPVWEKCYATRHAANFGIDGDRTQNVLWRMENGELDNIKPKVIVLMIGTNNTGEEKDGKPRNTPAETIAGLSVIVKDLRAKLPESKILLLAIFPRGEKDSPQRTQIAEINAALAKLDDGKRVKYLDIGAKFLEADGTLPKSVMPDLLHPNERGYQIWADAMESTLVELLK